MHRLRTTALLLCAATALPAGCRDAGPARVASVAVTPDSVPLHPTETVQLTAEPRDGEGRPLRDRAVTWSLSGPPGVATVSATGLVTALAPGTVQAVATADGVPGAAPVVVTLADVATIDVSPAVLALEVGFTQQLTATPRDDTGAPAVGWTVSWSSTDAAVARVSPWGLVTGVAPGTAAVIASVGSVAESVTVTVQPFAGDVAIVDAFMTQGVQDVPDSVPIVQDGLGVVVNVRLRATRANPALMQVVLRLLDGGGTAVYSDTALAIAGTTTPPYSEPTVQFYVPAAQLQAGRSWQLLRDPHGRLVDDSAATDVFPRGGPRAIALVRVPELKLHFVPVILTSYTSGIGNVGPNTVDQYLPVLLSVMPVGAVTPTIGAPFFSMLSFGTPPNGGGSTFWQSLLQSLDAARIADPTYADAHWIGVVRPPEGFTFTQFGGFGYIPPAYTSGANTRTSVLVGVGWFNRESQTRELVAHELGHNFGRRHAPCGGASGPDPAFPFANGTIGMTGFDVYARSRGAVPAPPVAPSTSDIMGYCTPVWSSVYTYAGALAFRGTVPATAPRAAAAPSPVRVLLVRGTIEGARVSLEPALAIVARPTPPGDGPFLVEGVDAAGRRLFSRAFTPAEVDHADARHFTVAVPLAEDTALSAIRVRGLGTEPAELRADETPRRAAPGALRVAGDGAGGVTVACGDTRARAIAVQDARTGRLYGVADGASLAVRVPAGARLAVSCSDGLRTARATVTAP
jgi:hypothetical protein